MTRGRTREDNLGALMEVALLINARKIQEAHDLLKKLTADPNSGVHDKPLSIMSLGDRINKELSCSPPSSSSS